MNLVFEAEGRQWPVVCDPAGAPRTLAALAACLPMPLQLHTPKIAGSHVYWHAPFVEAAEGGVDVLAAPPGAFIYWPTRQFLELVFAPLQAETAEITVLGHATAGLDELVALGAELRYGHGRRRFEGRLVAEGPAVAPRPVDPTVPGDLVDRRRALWAAAPAEIGGLVASRAIMHPAGPLFMAESELRCLHEALWWIRARIGTDGEDLLRHAAALATDRAGCRIRDFCHLVEGGRLLLDVAAAFRRREIAFAPLLDEATLIAGRLGAWLDLEIPWFDVNEAMRAAFDGVPRVPATVEL